MNTDAGMQTIGIKMVFVLILFKDASLLVYASRQVVKVNADKQTSGARSGVRRGIADCGGALPKGHRPGGGPGGVSGCFVKFV